MTDDLVAFLKARLDVDEQAARATGALYPWVATDDGEVFEVPGNLQDPHRCPEHVVGIPNMCSDLLVASGEDITDQLDTERAQHIVRHDPVRVLAEVQAKRRIIDLHQPRGVQGGPPYHWTCTFCDRAPAAWDNYTEWPCLTLRLLALPYASCEGYRGAWAPDTEVTS